MENPPVTPSHLSASLSVLVQSPSRCQAGFSLIPHSTAFLSGLTHPVVHFLSLDMLLSSQDYELVSYVRGADLALKQWYGVAASVGSCEPGVRTWFMKSEANSEGATRQALWRECSFHLSFPFSFFFPGCISTFPFLSSISYPTLWGGFV